MTDAHQSTDIQKGNPPSAAHHQHHLRFPPRWTEIDLPKNKKCSIPRGCDAVVVLPSLETATDPLFNAVPLLGGHWGALGSEARLKRTEIPRIRRQRGETERGGRREKREGGVGTPPQNTQTSCTSLQKHLMHKYERRRDGEKQRA